MSERFQRLYRGISESGIAQLKTPDEYAYAFEMERRQTLDSLGYKVGYTGDNDLQRNRHHGKLARKKNQLRDRLLQHNKEAKEAELAIWKKDYQKKLLQINSYHSLACKLQNAILTDSVITNTLLKKFVNPGVITNECEGDYDGSRKPRRTLLRDPSSLKLTYVPINMNLPDGCKPIGREKLLITKFKWSDCEKKKINDLFWVIDRPTSKNAAAWNAYHEMFIGRFLASFPCHTTKDVKRKILQMLSCRQLKMQGEEEYWEGMVRHSFCQPIETCSTQVALPPLTKKKALEILPEVI